MEKKASTFTHALTYGLIVGIALALYSLILYLLGLNLNKTAGYVSYLILLGGIIYSTKTFRDNGLGGSISYAKALGYGTLVAFFAAIVSAVYTYLSMTVIDPDLISKMLEMVEEELVKQGSLSDDQIEQVLEMQKPFMTPTFIAAMVIPTFTFVGFIFSLITSIFLKKDQSPFEVGNIE